MAGDPVKHATRVFHPEKQIHEVHCQRTIEHGFEVGGPKRYDHPFHQTFELADVQNQMIEQVGSNGRAVKFTHRRPLLQGLFRVMLDDLLLPKTPRRPI